MSCASPACALWLDESDNIPGTNLARWLLLRKISNWIGLNKLCHALGCSALATWPIGYDSRDSIGMNSSQKKKVNHNCPLPRIVLHVMLATPSVTVYTPFYASVCYYPRYNCV